MVELVLNGRKAYARPYEFDSDVTDQKNMKNAFGAFVKPVKAITTCNDCGQGITIQLSLGEPPFAPVVASCQMCHPEPEPLTDPFVNPLVINRINPLELDPLVHDIHKPIESITTTVAERKAERKEKQVSAATSDSKASADKSDRSKQKNAKPKRAVEPAPVDDIGQEVVFDDNDLIEP